MSGETTNAVNGQIQDIPPLSRVLLQPITGPQFECTLYLHDPSSNHLVVYASRQGDELTDLRLLKTSAVKKITPLAEKEKPQPSVSGKSTPKKGGATTPARRGSRPETPNPPKDELSEDGRLLLAGLGKHLSVKSRGKSIIVSLANTEAKIDPPYTKVEGEGDEMARVRRILESERSVLPKKGKKKDVKVPAMGG